MVLFYLATLHYRKGCSISYSLVLEYSFLVGYKWNPVQCEHDTWQDVTLFSIGMKIPLQYAKIKIEWATLISGRRFDYAEVIIQSWVQPWN